MADAPKATSATQKAVYMPARRSSCLVENLVTINTGRNAPSNAKATSEKLPAVTIPVIRAHAIASTIATPESNRMAAIMVTAAAGIR